MWTRSSLTRDLAMMVALVLAAGCASWRVTSETPARVLTEHPHRDLRVTVAQAPRIVLRDTRASEDTLYGYTDELPEKLHVTDVRRVPASGGRKVDQYGVAVPNARILTIETRETSTTKTALLIVCVGLVVASIIVGAAGNIGAPSSI